MRNGCEGGAGCMVIVVHTLPTRSIDRFAQSGCSSSRPVSTVDFSAQMRSPSSDTSSLVYNPHAARALLLQKQKSIQLTHSLTRTQNRQSQEITASRKKGHDVGPQATRAAASHHIYPRM